MAKLTKRARLIRDKVEATKEYEINEAVALLKELATAKFAESVDVAVNLGIDAKNLTKTFVVQLYFQTVLVKTFVLPYSLKVQMLKQLKKLVQTSLVWTT